MFDYQQVETLTEWFTLKDGYTGGEVRALIMGLVVGLPLVSMKLILFGSLWTIEGISY